MPPEEARDAPWRYVPDRQVRMADMKKGDKNHRLAFVSFSVVVFYCLYLPECRVDATARCYSLVRRFYVWYVADCVRLPLQKS